MKPENRAILDAARHHYTTIVQAEFCRNLSGQEREDIQRVIGEEFQRGYVTDLWCTPCVFNMIILAFQYYDKFLEQEAQQQRQRAEELEKVLQPAPVVQEIKPEDQNLATPADPEEDFSPAPLPEPLKEDERYAPAGNPETVKTGFPQNKPNGKPKNMRI
jgi:hypothetical protein